MRRYGIRGAEKNTSVEMKTSISILLVDDDQDDQEFFLEAVREIENVTLFDIACNGKEALKALTSSIDLPEIIFMDVDMPVMDGMECLSEILKNPKTQNVPVVMLTTSNGFRKQALALGARAFITKPADGKELRERLEAVFKNYNNAAKSSLAG